MSINVHEVYSETRSRWIATEAPRVPWAVRVAAGVNWSVLIVALAAFGLSAKHTVDVFSVVSPGVAWLAPVMIELGLAYAALRAKIGQLHQEKPGRVMLALVGLLVVAAFASNLAGGLTAAALSSGVTGLSGAEIYARFSTLPLSVQAGLLIAILMAFIVPTVSIVAGEGVAALLFDTRRGETDWLEQRWREVEREVLYREVFARLNGGGLPPREAARLAQAEVRAYLAPVDPGRRLLPSTTATQTGPGEMAQLSTTSSTSSTVDGPVDGSNKSAAIRAYLEAHPGAGRMTVDELQELLRETGIDASRALVGRVARERRAR